MTTGTTGTPVGPMRPGKLGLRHPLVGTALVALLMLSAVAICLFAIRWAFAADELQRLQARSDAMTRVSGLMQQLATEAIDYGRRNPDIHPVLTRLNLKGAGLTATNPPVPSAAPAR